MHDDLAAAIDSHLPAMRTALEDLIRIPSVSAPGYDPAEVRRSATATADLFRRAGLRDVRLLELDDAHPAVFGEIPPPEGAPTVLLYAHHDVQPPGPASEWDTDDAFEPVERDGRLYGRGSSDDKAGIVVHIGALLAHNGAPPIGVKLLVEGEEEIGSTHLEEFLIEYHELLAADVIVIADSGNWRTGVPSLTTSLRGLVDCIVEVRTLRHAIHSGMYGGVVPDAISALARLIATLHDDQGNVAVPGLVTGEAEPLDLTEDALRTEAETVDELQLIGEGSLTSRMWMKPAISVLAIDAPPVAEAINQLVPVARAKVSMRLAPGDDPAQAMDALIAHLEHNAPWGAQVTVERGATGEAFALDTTGPAYDAFREAFSAAWGADTIDIGVGGSIPFVAAFSDQYPEATILLTGVADHRSRPHGPNESVDLDEVRRGALAEAIVLRLLGDGYRPDGLVSDQP
jgi:acetylornithine deacetylase/succinyl-diaminopimelate desuccinylase-like protein